MESSPLPVGSVAKPSRLGGIGGRMRRTVASYGIALVAQILSTRGPSRTMSNHLAMVMLPMVLTASMVRRMSLLLRSSRIMSLTNDHGSLPILMGCLLNLNYILEETEGWLSSQA
uniref:Uncharacterized protein n=1 Tax=Opuntia streptacantha TaxID=393608 RepID=A0A7C8ZJE9_OPUST